MPARPAVAGIILSLASAGLLLGLAWGHLLATLRVWSTFVIGGARRLNGCPGTRAWWRTPVLTVFGVIVIPVIPWRDRHHGEARRRFFAY